MRSMHRLATAALALALAGPAAAQRPAPVPRPGPAPRPAACCDVVGIDARTGVVSAKVNASDEVFEFKVADARTLNALRVGQRVHADFARKEVSLDGRTPCCTITSGPQGAAVARAPVRPPLTTDRAGGGGALLPAAGARLGGAPLPRVSYGEPIPASAAEPVARAAARFATRTVTARQGGRDLSATVLVVGGRVGMKQVPADALPDGARRLLEMHARTLRRDESGYYIVDPAAAREWAKTHAVPDHIKPKEEEKKDDSECGDKWSMNAAQDCVQDAGDAVAAEWERARERAEQWWKGSTSELADLWGETASCFTERTLPGGRAPVKFAITPSMTVDMQQSGSKGAADGAIKGVVRLGIPIEADFEAETKFFYIPCLPFAVRPKELTADGAMTVGQQLGIEVEATGSFAKTFTIPPTGGPQIPLQVIPIIIGNVPVAVLDVSAYIEGEVEVEGKGEARGQFAVANSHRSTFEFTCDGQGCKGKSKGKTEPATANERAEIQGQVSVKPGIYTALQLNLNYNVLGARAGPQPFLLGTAIGCAAGSASQSTRGVSTSETSAALTADLDWGVQIRAEALAGGQRIGSRWEYEAMDPRHIWFRDLAPGGSTALQATVAAPAAVTAARAASFKLRMPACYPYSEPVHYRITWTGNATPAPNPACSWEAGAGTCRYHPAKDLAFNLSWPTPGTYAVSAVLLKDGHRTFASAPPVGLEIVVAAGEGGVP